MFLGIGIASHAHRSLSQHMLGHVVLMSLVAPLAAAWMLRAGETLPLRRPHLGLVTGLQILALWLLHAPSVMHAVMISGAVRVAASTGLFAVAALFWLAVFNRGRGDQWLALAALLVTGKLFCLLAALLVFAPRPLYSLICYGGVSGADALAAQQFAGLVMVVICPVTYVATGLFMASRLLSDLSGFGSSQDLRT
ncbi:MAG: cytochrome c oxidase assembly protein [Hyphomicrobiaceae bacterium]